MVNIDVLADLTSYAVTLSKKAKSNGRIFELNYPNINAFSAICNGLILTAELLDHYYNKWTDEGIKEIKGQYEERIVTISKWAFIHSFSIIEYISKKFIIEKNHQYFKNIINKINTGSNVYFSSIIKRSRKKSLINKHDKKVWNGLREIRNCIVHNNAFSNKNIDFKVDEYHIKYKKDEPITGGIAFGLALTKFLINYYYDWVKAVINLNISFAV